MEFVGDNDSKRITLTIGMEGQTIMTRVQKQASTRPTIWAVGGGKGGVGKSLVSILLAMALARNNQKTILVDVDLGGANLHTLLGIKTPVRSINDFVSRKYGSIEEICVRTQIDNLDLICGASEILSLANPQFAQKNKIAQSITQLNAEHVIMDLGAGTSYNVLDFFLIADKPIVVLTPQPISIQNAYAFIRNTVYRKLSRIAGQKTSLQEVIRTAMDPKNERKLRTIRDLQEAVRKSHGVKAANSIPEAIGSIRPLLITNMARDSRDNNAGRIIQLVAEKYLTIEATEAGVIDYDPEIENMISHMMPISALDSDSRSLASAAAIAGKLLRHAPKNAVVS